MLFSTAKRKLRFDKLSLRNLIRSKILFFFLSFFLVDLVASKAKAQLLLRVINLFSFLFFTSCESEETIKKFSLKLYSNVSSYEI